MEMYQLEKKDLKHFEERFNAIVLRNDIDQESKDIDLSQLMIEMEQNFDIPRYKNLDYQRKNQKVISLYKQIAFARSI